MRWVLAFVVAVAFVAQTSGQEPHQTTSCESLKAGPSGPECLSCGLKWDARQQRALEVLLPCLVDAWDDACDAQAAWKMMSRLEEEAKFRVQRGGKTHAQATQDSQENDQLFLKKRKDWAMAKCPNAPDVCLAARDFVQSVLVVLMMFLFGFMVHLLTLDYHVILKFVQRHWGPVGIVTAMFACLVLVII